MLSVRKLNQEFYTRIFEFYTPTKDKILNFATGAPYVLAGPLMHAAAVN
jgi:hypothetical protein